MRKVQLSPGRQSSPPTLRAESRAVWARPWWWVGAGVVALAAIGTAVPLPPLAWVAGVGYLVVSSLLLSLGLHRRGATRFGPANAVTATRSMLVGVATALVVAEFGGPTVVPGDGANAASTVLLVVVAAVALALDGVDGFVARRTRSVSELGARFDMEVDAFLLLVLSVHDVRLVGWWVLAIGLMRYAFVGAAWLLPFMGRTLPYRYWRKVVAAACGVALTVVAAHVLPAAANVVIAAAALALLVESFGRDVLWLIRMNHAGADLVSPEKASARDESR